VPKLPQLIAIDIDDVIADTKAAARAWVTVASGIVLDESVYESHSGYWDYYNRIWAAHGISGVRYEQFLDELIEDQSHMPLLAGAQFAVRELRKNYRIVLITARDPLLEKATRRWIDEHLGNDIQLFLSSNPLVRSTHKSKGQLCRELGASLLIDDNVENCKSALDAGVKAILFGRYAWQKDPPLQAVNIRSWPEVLEYIDGHADF